MGVRWRKGQFQFIIHKVSLPLIVEDSVDELNGSGRVGGGRRGGGYGVVWELEVRVGAVNQQARHRKHKQHR